MNEKRILIFDGSYFLARFSSSSRILYNSDGIDISVLYYLLKLLADNIIRYQPDKVYLTIDIGRDIIKKEKLKEYKAKRIASSKELYNRFSDETYEKYSLARYVISSELADILPIGIVAIPLVEGDTVVYYIADKFAKQGNKVIIFTGDKDLLQGIDKNINLSFSNQKLGYEFLTIQEYEYIYSKFDLNVSSKSFFYPRNLSYYRAILGDISDNIIGVKGIGTKACSKLIKLAQDDGIEIFETPDDFINYYENKLKEVKDNNIKRILKILLDNIDIWLNVYEVIDLRNAIQKDLSGARVVEIEQELQKETKFSLTKIMDIFRKYDLNSETRYIEWLNAFEALYEKDYSLISKKLNNLNDFSYLLTNLDNKIQKIYFKNHKEV